jgi:hypothetical protein
VTKKDKRKGKSRVTFTLFLLERKGSIEKFACQEGGIFAQKTHFPFLRGGRSGEAGPLYRRISASMVDKWKKNG